MIDKLLSGQRPQLKYDFDYLKSLQESFPVDVPPIVTNKRMRFTFEAYTRYLKHYAEQKYFSNFIDVKEFAMNLAKEERERSNQRLGTSIY